MSTINNNYNFTATSPEIRKRLESQENFSALDKEKLKQDTAEFAKTQTDDFKKENFVFRIMRSFGSKDPKKTLKSIGLTIVTVAGVAFIGNMLARPSFKLGGEKIDDFLLNGDNFISKGYRAVADFFVSKKANLAKKMSESNSKTVRNIYETFKNRATKPINPWAKTYPSGGRGIFALTPPDVLETGLRKGSALDNIEKLISSTIKIDGGLFSGKQKAETTKQIISTFFGSGQEKTVDMLKELNIPEEKITDIINQLTGSKDYISGTLSKLFDDEAAKSIFDKIFVTGSFDNIDICREMANGLRGIDPADKKAVIKFLSEDLADSRTLEQLRKKGVIIPDETIEAFKSITNVDMNRGDFFHSWWPVNILDKVFGKAAKAMGKEWKGFARGNFGNALMKFEAMDGTLAKTMPGRFVQKSVIFPAEYISNFVNDKSGFGVFLCANLLSLYNTAQDAPKGKKVPTVANDFVGTIGNVAVSMPLGAGIVYKIATLKNLDTNILTFIPKTIGKIVGLGLDNFKDGKMIPTSNPVARTVGGAIRLGLIMFVVMPKISKVVNGLIAKVLGKPYDPNEEKLKHETEQAQSQVIPELGITQKEFLEKAQAHPEVMEKLQKDPMLQREINSNPKLMLDLLDGKVPETKPKDTLLSPANRNFLSGTNKIGTALDKKLSKAEEQEYNSDTATYIPSYEYKAKSDADDSQMAEINRILGNADKTLARAEKYL